MIIFHSKRQGNSFNLDQCAQRWIPLSTGAKPVLGPNCMIPYINKGSNFDLDRTLNTRFKRLKNQNVYVICKLCKFYKIVQCFNYMHVKFQVVGFQNKEIYVIVLSISSVYFYSDIYRSRWLGGFLPLTAAKFRLVWKISDQSIKTSPQIYAIFFLKL